MSEDFLDLKLLVKEMMAMEDFIMMEDGRRLQKEFLIIIN